MWTTCGCPGFAACLRILGRSFRRDRAGAVAILFALVLPILVGFIGLGVEAGYWYAQRRDLQAAADAAAIGGAREVLANSSVSDSYLASVGEKEALRNGTTVGGSISMIVNHPPGSGSYTTDTDAVEATLSAPIQTMFARMFVGSSVTTTVRAVARSQMQDGEPPALASSADAERHLLCARQDRGTAPLGGPGLPAVRGLDGSSRAAPLDGPDSRPRTAGATEMGLVRRRRTRLV